MPPWGGARAEGARWSGRSFRSLRSVTGAAGAVLCGSKSISVGVSHRLLAPQAAAPRGDCQCVCVCVCHPTRLFILIICICSRQLLCHPSAFIRPSLRSPPFQMANQRLRLDIERLIGQGAQVVADPSHRAQLVLRAPGEGGGVRKLRVVKPDGTPTPAGIELQRQLNANPALRVGGRFNLALAEHLSDTHVLQPNGRFRLARRPPPPGGGGEVQHTDFGRRRFEKARAEWVVHVPIIWGATSHSAEVGIISARRRTRTRASPT